MLMDGSNASPNGLEDNHDFLHLVYLKNTLSVIDDDLYTPSDVFNEEFFSRCATIRRQNPADFLDEIEPLLKQRLGRDFLKWEKQFEAYVRSHTPIKAKLVEDIEPRDADYLWCAYLARGELTLVSGLHGVGKTWFGFWCAAVASRGWPWPQATGMATHLPPGKPLKVFIMTRENSAEVVVRPRLDLLGADVSRIALAEEPNLFSLSNPEPLAERLRREHDDLVVIDPITSYHGDQINPISQPAVRQALEQMTQIARDHQVAILLGLNWNKQGQAATTYRASGSMAYKDVPRIVLAAGKHPDHDQHLFIATEKNNLGLWGATQEYDLTGYQCRYVGVADLRAEDLADQPRPRTATTRNACEEWLREQLADGPQPRSAVEKAATLAGFSERTLRRAREQLGIITWREKALHARTFWALPGTERPEG